MSLTSTFGNPTWKRTALRKLDYQTLIAGLETSYDILCLDTEFTRLPLDKEAVWIWAEQAQILSVALASLNDQLPPSHLYVIRTIDAEIRRKCTPFVLSDVLPHMSTAVADSKGWALRYDSCSGFTQWPAGYS